MSTNLTVGIVGYGFVGGAVSYGFNTPGVKQFIADPKLGSSIDDIPNNVDVIFVCVPTPMNEDFSINSSIVEKTVEELLQKTEHCPIVIKSTVTPDKLQTLKENKDERTPEEIRAWITMNMNYNSLSYCGW